MDNNVRSDNMSDFSDFVLISNEVMKWLGYEFTIFGTYLSVFDVIISCFILSISISFVLKLFGGD